MKLFNFLRKPIFALLLSGIVLFVSCNQYDSMENSSENLSIDELKNIHSEIKNQFSANSLSKAKNSNDQEFIDAFLSEYNNNLQLAQNEGVEALFASQGLDTSLPSTVSWALNNLDSENFYEELLEREEITSSRDAQLLFSYILTAIDVQNDMNNLANKPSFYLKRVDCAWAVASTIVATAIFAGVVIASGGVGLAAAVGFFAGKTWATIGIARACNK